MARELKGRYPQILDDPKQGAAARELFDNAQAMLARIEKEKLLRARHEWGYGTGEGLSKQDLIAEKYRGIRPAFGYPACPDHTLKGRLWELLDAEASAGASAATRWSPTPSAPA